MSKTEIVTPQVQERQIENQINRAVRHCRIGKVTENHPRQYAALGAMVNDAVRQTAPVTAWAIAALNRRLGLDAYGAQ